MIKPIAPSAKHPRGGLKITKTVFDAGHTPGAPGKREASLWAEDYSTPRAMQKEAARIEHQFDAELREIRKKTRERSGDYGNPAEITFELVARRRMTVEGDSSMRSQFERLIADFGAFRAPQWRDFYQTYIRKLQGEISPKTKRKLTPAAINRYKAVFRMVFKFALKENIIQHMPVVIELDAEDERDVVWTEEERKKVFEVMERRHSWLYWHIYFSQYNKIRIGDLCSLARENYDPINNRITFYASKTKKRYLKKGKVTTLKMIDQPLRDHFASLPADCPFLFPRIMPDGTWHQVAITETYREYEKEWEAICKEAGVSLRVHDLNHCAATWLWDNGWTDRDFEACNISTSRMRKRYVQQNADNAKVISGFERPELKIFKSA